MHSHYTVYLNAPAGIIISDLPRKLQVINHVPVLT